MISVVKRYTESDSPSAEQASFLLTDPGIDKSFALPHGISATLQGVICNILHGINIIQDCAIDAAHGGINVARHGEVDQKEGFSMADGAGLPDHRSTNHIHRSSGGDDDNIGGLKVGNPFGKANNTTTDTFCEIHSAII